MATTILDVLGQMAVTAVPSCLAIIFGYKQVIKAHEHNLKVQKSEAENSITKFKTEMLINEKNRAYSAYLSALTLAPITARTAMFAELNFNLSTVQAAAYAPRDLRKRMLELSKIYDTVEYSRKIAETKVDKTLAETMLMESGNAQLDVLVTATTEEIINRILDDWYATLEVNNASDEAKR